MRSGCWNTVSWRETPSHSENMKQSETFQSRRPCREERYTCFICVCKGKLKDMSPGRRRDAPRNAFCKDFVALTTKRPCRDAPRNIFCKDFVASTTQSPGGQERCKFCIVFYNKKLIHMSPGRRRDAPRSVFCKDLVASTTKHSTLKEKYNFCVVFYNKKWDLPDTPAISRGEGGVRVYINKE